MGSLKLPASGSVYFDANAMIYSVEKIQPYLKAPDAIHAATALDVGAALFITNDSGFRRVSGLPVVVLSELLPERQKHRC